MLHSLCHVEDSEEFLFSADSCNFEPLFLCKINTSGVMGTSVKYYDISRTRLRSQSSCHALKVQRLEPLVEVRVGPLLHAQANQSPNL